MSHGKSVELSKKTKSYFLAIGAAEKAKKNLHTLCGLSSHQRKKASSPQNHS
jgi:hypothetical protein